MSKEPTKRPPKLISALPELLNKRMYYLNSFRRKPAITRNVQSFTPNRKSSQFYATNTSSAFQYLFKILSAYSRLDLLVSGLIHITNSQYFILNFFTPTFLNLSSLYKLTCWTLIKRYVITIKIALTACQLKISVLFNSIILDTFSPFLHSTSTLSIISNIQTQ